MFMFMRGEKNTMDLSFEHLQCFYALIRYPPEHVLDTFFWMSCELPCVAAIVTSSHHINVPSVKSTYGRCFKVFRTVLRLHVVPGRSTSL